jgi:hypothetical protein
MRILALFILFSSFSVQAKPLVLNGDSITVLCTQLLGQDHVCRHYNKNGKFIKRTRNWSLDNQAQRLTKVFKNAK